MSLLNCNLQCDVLPHITTAVVSKFLIGAVRPLRDVSVAFVIRRGGGLVVDLRDAKSADFLYRLCGIN